MPRALDEENNDFENFSKKSQSIGLEKIEKFMKKYGNFENGLKKNQALSHDAGELANLTSHVRGPREHFCQAYALVASLLTFCVKPMLWTFCRE